MAFKRHIRIRQIRTIPFNPEDGIRHFGMFLAFI